MIETATSDTQLTVSTSCWKQSTESSSDRMALEVMMSVKTAGPKSRTVSTQAKEPTAAVAERILELAFETPLFGWIGLFHSDFQGIFMVFSGCSGNFHVFRLKRSV